MQVDRRTFLAGAAAATALSSGAMRAMRNASAQAEDHVYELRQYTLHKDRRDDLVRLFEAEFITPQNAVGAHVVGIFRDLDDPDRFVWIRSFEDMAARKQALETFYDGPVWQAHKSAANATMLDSDNVLLLRPVADGLGFSAERAPAPRNQHDMISANIFYLGQVDAALFAQFFSQAILPVLASMGVHPLAQLETESAANNFRLPVREHDRVYAWFARWPSPEAEHVFSEKFARLSGWRDSAPDAVLPALARKPEKLRLVPTSHSPLQ